MEIKMDNATCIALMFSIFFIAVIISDIIHYFKYKYTMKTISQIPEKERKQFIQDIRDANKEIQSSNDILTKEQYEDEFNVKDDRFD